MNIDLRKSDPLGEDFTKAYVRAKVAMNTWQQMGPPDTSLPRYRDHYNERARLAEIVVDFVTLARIIAQAVGSYKANQVPGLRFAIAFNGLKES